MTNIFAKKTKNVGDLVCAPSRYFDLKAEEKDIFDPVDPEKPLIIGGGGLFFPYFQKYLEEKVSRHKAPVFIWGVGTNTHGGKKAEAPSWLDKAALVGIRDWGTGHDWVPCASCMSDYFDSQAAPKTRMVVYHHGDYLLPAKDLPSMSNFNTTLDEVVRFMLQAEFVWTNSYHGVFWATLLGRKVIVSPFSSRHLFFKHPPVVLKSDQTLEQAMELAKGYPEALAECREANRFFYSRVISTLDN